MELTDGFTWAWLAWGLGFVAIEGAALLRKAPGDTLSEHIWKWFQTRKSNPKALALRAGLLAFMAG